MVQTKNRKYALFAGLALLSALALSVMLQDWSTRRESGPDVYSKTLQEQSGESAQENVEEKSQDIDIIHTEVELANKNRDYLRELMDGMLIAAQEADDYAVREFRRKLLESDNGYVTELAQTYLNQEREDGPMKAIGNGPYARRLACLLYFVGIKHPEIIFARIRAYWSNPYIQGDRVKSWRKIESLPDHTYAARALVPGDILEIEAISAVLVADVTNQVACMNAAFRWLIETYELPLSDGEVPDPWLSHILERMLLHKAHITTAGWESISPWLLSVKHQPRFSDRLRKQVAELLVETPNSIWQLLDALSTAESVKVAAALLAEFLVTRTLTIEETEMLLETIRQQYGDTGDEYRVLMSECIARGYGKIPVDNLRVLARTLLELGQKTTDVGQCASAIYMLWGMRTAWSHRSIRGKQLGAMFVDYDGAAMVGIVQLHEKMTKGKHKDLKGMGRVPAARLMELGWLSDCDVSKRLQSELDMLKRYESIELVEFLAVVNGLDRVSGEIGTSHATIIVEIMHVLIDKASSEVVSLTDPKKRPVDVASPEVIYVSQIAPILAATGYPMLGEKERAWILKAAYVVIEDAEYLSGKHEPTPVSKDAIKDVIHAAEKVVEIYG